MKQTAMIFALSLVLVGITCGRAESEADATKTTLTTQSETQQTTADDSEPVAQTTTQVDLRETTSENPDSEGLTITLQDSLDGFESPESVLRIGNSMYVSNVGKEMKPSEMDGDGSITLLDIDGEIVSRKIFPTATILHAPKGMAEIDGVLYVADINRVVGFSTETRDQVYDLDLSSTGMTFANDLARLDLTGLVLTVTDLNKIYRVETGEEPGFMEIPTQGELVHPNGVVVIEDERPQGTMISRQLYINGYPLAEGTQGMISSITFTMDTSDVAAAFADWDGPKVQVIAPTTGSFDGMALLTPNHLLVSDWTGDNGHGQFHLITLDSQAVQTFPIPAPSTADFYWDAETQTVWLPTMQTNQVHRFKVAGLPETQL